MVWDAVQASLMLREKGAVPAKKWEIVQSCVMDHTGQLELNAIKERYAPSC